MRRPHLAALVLYGALAAVVFHRIVVHPGSNVVAPRFSLVTDLAVAFVGAQLIDHLATLDLVRQSRPLAVAGLAALALVAVSVAPTGPTGDLRVVVEPWFRSPGVKAIRDGSTVVLLPAPPHSAHAAMLWASVATCGSRWSVATTGARTAC